MTDTEKRPATSDTEKQPGTLALSRTPTVAATDSAPATSDAEKTEVDRAVTKEEATTTVVPVGQQAHEFPDGGFLAWQVVAGAWLASFCTWGYVNAFGVYQDYYQLHQLSSYTPSDISWIGSVQLAMIFWGGLPCGRLFDMGYLRHIMIAGSIWTVFCLMMTSLATKYWQILLAQGFGLGIGLGMLFIPSVSCVSHWFRRRRALANGVLATGSSTGGIVFPVMLNNLANNPKVGFPWAVRATGFLVLFMLILSIFLLRTRLPPNKSGGPIVDFRVFKDINYTIFCLGCWFILFGLYFCFFYLQEYAAIQGVSTNLAFYTLAILNAGSIFGRTIPNYLADTWGPLNILFGSTIFAGMLTFVLLALKKAYSFVVFSLFFGFFSGAYVSTIAPCIASLTEDMRTIGLRLSMGFAVQGFAALFGTPVAGAIITRQNGSFVGACCFSGSSVFIGCMILFVARTRRAKQKGTYRI